MTKGKFEDNANADCMLVDIDEVERLPNMPRTELQRSSNGFAPSASPQPRVSEEEPHFKWVDEALVNYFKGNDFLQTVARHIQILESRSGAQSPMKHGATASSFNIVPDGPFVSNAVPGCTGNAPVLPFKSGGLVVVENPPATAAKEDGAKSDSVKKAKVKRKATPDAGTQSETTILTEHDHVHESTLGHIFDKRSDAHAHKAAVFADAESMKEQVRLAIHQKPYDVMEFYYEEGYAQAIARNAWFENITLGVISFNALWIAIDTDINEAATLADADPIFIFAENFFCVYFCLEWLIRFAAFEIKRNSLRDNWFIFDTVLVFCMVSETWILSAVAEAGSMPVSDTSVLKLIRITRLSRMARMAKLLRAMPELLVLVKGMAVASRSVFYTLSLLMAIIYVFAVAFRQLTDGLEVGDTYFSSVPHAMSSLLLQGTLPDLAVFVTNVGREHIAIAVMLLLFVLLASLTVMNMLVGVLVEVVSVVSAVEKEELNVAYVKSRLKTISETYGSVDEDGDNCLNAHEFRDLLLVPEAASAIKDVGVDPVGLVDFAEFIFRDEAEITFGDFIEIILTFRGSNSCTVKDVVDLRRYLMTEMRTLDQHFDSMLDMLRTLIGHIGEPVPTPKNRSATIIPGGDVSNPAPYSRLNSNRKSRQGVGDDADTLRDTAGVRRPKFSLL